MYDSWMIGVIRGSTLKDHLKLRGIEAVSLQRL